MLLSLSAETIIDEDIQGESVGDTDRDKRQLSACYVLERTKQALRFYKTAILWPYICAWHTPRDETNSLKYFRCPFPLNSLHLFPNLFSASSVSCIVGTKFFLKLSLIMSLSTQVSSQNLASLSLSSSHAPCYHSGDPFFRLC